jgi:hypothetical protein
VSCQVSTADRIRGKDITMNPKLSAAVSAALFVLGSGPALAEHFGKLSMFG